MSNKLVLSKALLDLSQKTGLTQAQIGDQLGVSRITVYRWITGERIPHPYHWRKLEALLHISQETLQAPLPDTQRSPVSLALLDPTMPPPPSVLLGRENAIGTIRASLCTPTTTGAPPVAVLYGLPGVGKTALTTALAYDEDIRRRFPAGVLWAGLGQHPDYFRLLSHWGQVLGISPKVMETQTSLDEWARLLRLAIKDRSFLIVLDDAWSTEDALALQIGAPNCTYVITTRKASIAAELTGQENIYRVQELTEHDSLRLVEHFAPEVAQEEHAPLLKALVQVVGNLPLALTLIGHTIRRHSDTGQTRRIHTTLQRLSDLHERLALRFPSPPPSLSPSLTDTPSSLHSVIALSTDLLSAHACQALYALSILPAKPHTFAEGIACAVAACSFEHLDELTDAGLLELNTGDRYSLHQTIADYAQTHLLPQDKNDATQRLLSTVRSYVEQHGTDYELLARESSVILAAFDAAVVTLEYPMLLALVSHTMNFMVSQAWFDQCERYLQILAHVAEERNDPEGRATALLFQGIIARKRNNMSGAEEILREGVSLAKAHQLSAALIELYIALCGVLMRLGKTQQSIEYAREGITLAESTGNQAQVCHLLHAHSQSLYISGNVVETKAMLRKGLVLARAINHKEVMCKFFVDGAGYALLSGELAEGLDLFEEGLEVAKSIGHREYMCALLINAGNGYQRLTAEPHYLQKADELLQEALLIAQELNHTEYLSATWSNLADVALHRGHFEDAVNYHSLAFRLAQETGNTVLESQGCLYLAILMLLGEEVEHALSYVQQGLDISSRSHKHTYQGMLLFIRATAHAMRAHEQDAAIARDNFLKAASVWEDAGQGTFLKVAWCALGCLAVDQEQWSDAQEYFARIASTPEEMLEIFQLTETDSLWSAPYLYALARLTWHQGKEEQARKLAQDAVNRLQSREPVLYSSGRTMLRTIQQWLMLHASR